MSAEQSLQFAQAVSAASGRADVREAVVAVYAGVQAEIDRRQPVCQISGRCCRFETYGHRLFVTTIELAAFRADAAALQAAPSVRPWDGTGCLYQVGGRCGVHAIRPFGCRIYFCDATAAEWQQAQYEQFHARIRGLHEQLGVPYYYVEWREALRAAGLGSTEPEATGGGRQPEDPSTTADSF